jgi:hypothetical protein
LLIETAIGEHAATVDRKNAGEIRMVQRQGRLPVIHVHGAIRNGEAGPLYDITEADLYPIDYRPLLAELRSAMHDADALVLIGYRMADPDIRAMFQQFRQDLAFRGKAADKYTYVVSPAHGEIHYKLESSVWESRGAEWLPLDAEDFLRDIVGRLLQRDHEEIREAVCRKYDIDRAALARMVQRIRDLLDIDEQQALGFLNSTRLQGASK